MWIPDANLKGPLSRMDARVKLVSVFGFTALVSTLNEIYALGMAAGLVTAAVLLSGLGFKHIARRMLLTLPFALAFTIFLPFIIPGEPVLQVRAGFIDLAASIDGLDRAAILALRIYTAVLAVSLITASSSFPELAGALRELKAPVILVQIVEFALRYILVVGGEAQRMVLAGRCRGFKPGRFMGDGYTMKVLGRLAGTIFIRSWHRGDRIYNAMLSRGYTGEQAGVYLHNKIKAGDLSWGICILAAGIILKLC